MRQSLYDYCVENNRIELLEQWDEAANLPQTPHTITYGSKQKVAWRCEHGHKWRAQVSSRTGNHSGCPVCAGLAILPGENDLQTLFPELAAEWHPTKNAGVTSADVGAFTHRKAWWRCETCGHEWLAEIKSRANGCGCPVCAGKTIVPGINDLATRFPEIAAEWNEDKNTVLCAGDISPGSRKKVWWRCGTCGSDYQASVVSRTNGTGCPVCAGKTVVTGVNDLASKYPLLAEEWHPTKNGHLTPEKVASQSNKNVWWRCSLGHEYQARVASRTVNQEGCPYCSGQRVLKGFNDLATVFPKIAAQWHPTKNEGLTPDEVTCGSAKKVWWKCNVCGYEWKAIIYSRAGAQRCGCPMCAGKVRTNNRPRYQYIAMEAPRPVINRRISSGRDSPVQLSPPGMTKTGTDPT
jgi:DNA-directed RNA polymerase subunit RPC12/RpoP